MPARLSAVGALVLLGAAGCTPAMKASGVAPSSAPAGLHSVHSPGAIAQDEVLVKGQCASRGRTRKTVLPDPACTPGAYDPAVTQANIAQTICVKGYTATVRPPEAVSEPVKKRLMTDYGLAGKSLRGYELDHLVPLELGGANSLTNLWPEFGSSPNPKDTVENKLHAEVCAGTVSLTEAQQKIARDWTKER